ncbi:LuxR C-terminal-related transcriptional regulator [Amycolatopsis sp. FBCC-B4732]|uniref:helix-turn-helix transcriptional regulator n=1 Tax=Amycolatopsis sp. FBCC-B4732 TaxID=3079339 RepID=UPI001FF33085|nr:LuxR C-terminal-related transcriptional regulator [Amycolatopsis sp. FBCC-B4732]UOX92204.1 LuxR C-terminal-related transcriptional regulator [Amycolatopsis sp. FBCC-B4732]
MDEAAGSEQENKVDNDVSATEVIGKLLPERVRGLRRLSGVPVAFGGLTRHHAGRRELVLDRLDGTLGTSLRGLAVQSGRGLGGSVLRDGAARRVDDYASTVTITHDYDRVVVHEERLTSIFAVPVTVHGSVRCVLYGAVRDLRPIGDRALHAATVLAGQLQRDAEAALAPEPPPDALTELAAIVDDIPDPALRARLARVHRTLRGEAPEPANRPALAPRELDALRLVEVGATNVEIAARLGLSPETIKAYLRAAMRKLDVHTRTAAAHAARRAGVL